MTIIEFPGGLDNKQFRLFVLRTMQARKKRLALSSTEKEIATALDNHADIERELDKNRILFNYHFHKNEFNPFAHLAAHIEVKRQIENDNPKGVQQVFEEISKHQHKSDAVELICGIFEYLLNKDTGEIIDTESYIHELEKAAADGFYEPDSDEYLETAADVKETDIPENREMAALERFGFITSQMVDDLQTQIAQQWHEEASTKPIKLKTRLKAALNKLPAQWVEAMALSHHRPPQRINRDRIADLCRFLTSEKVLQEIVRNLSEMEKSALGMIIGEDGWIKYSKLTREFGDETQDSYWWVEIPPRTVIGQLRLKGLVVVGKAPIGKKQFKVVVIPIELREIIQRSLNNISIQPQNRDGG